MLTHLMGEDHQIWRFGICRLMTHVPSSPRSILSTPCCAATTRESTAITNGRLAFQQYQQAIKRTASEMSDSSSISSTPSSQLRMPCSVSSASSMKRFSSSTSASLENWRAADPSRVRGAATDQHEEEVADERRSGVLMRLATTCDAAGTRGRASSLRTRARMMDELSRLVGLLFGWECQ
jgi:hypothetical protein